MREKEGEMQYKSKEEYRDYTMCCWITEKDETGCGVPRNRFQSDNTNETKQTLVRVVSS